MQPAPARDQLVARPEIEVIGVAQNNGGPGLFEVTDRERFHDALRPHGHERGGVDIAMRRPDDAPSGAAGVGEGE